MDTVSVNRHHVGEVGHVAHHLRKSGWWVGQGESFRGETVLRYRLGGQAEVAGQAVELRDHRGLRWRAEQVHRDRGGVVVGSGR